MLLTKKINVRVTSNMCKYYRSKGYEFQCNDFIEIDIEDLPTSSNLKVLVKCDVCSKEYELTYFDYNRRSKDFTYCKDCKKYKSRATCIKKYGVSNVFQVESFQEKQHQTILERYGCDNVFQNDEIKDKSRKTLIAKYGVDHPMKVDSIKKQVFEKGRETMYNNGTQSCSRQQLYIHKLYGGELNYLYSNLWFDIYFPKYKIYFEYDGSGHDIDVKYNHLTKSEFLSKEIKRYKYLESCGFKEFRLISRRDFIPTDEILLSIKELAFLVLENSISNYIVFDIDNQVIKFHNNLISYNYVEPLNSYCNDWWGEHLVTDEGTV